MSKKPGKKLSEWTLVLLLLVGIGMGALIYRSTLPPEPAQCQLCDRPVHHPTAFSLVVKGRETWACCARCGLSIYRTGAEDVRQAVATDFPTGRRVPAERCVYVEGSDLTPCCAPHVIVTPEKLVGHRCFDRCYPSVIAFEAPGEAAKYATEHGGTIVSFETLIREVKRP